MRGQTANGLLWGVATEPGHSGKVGYLWASGKEERLGALRTLVTSSKAGENG